MVQKALEEISISFISKPNMWQEEGRNQYVTLREGPTKVRAGDNIMTMTQRSRCWSSRFWGCMKINKSIKQLHSYKTAILSSAPLINEAGLINFTFCKTKMLIFQNYFPLFLLFSWTFKPVFIFVWPFLACIRHVYIWHVLHFILELNSCTFKGNFSCPPAALASKSGSLQYQKLHFGVIPYNYRV